jgi:hypothetical protein
VSFAYIPPPPDVDPPSGINPDPLIVRNGQNAAGTQNTLLAIGSFGVIRTSANCHYTNIGGIFTFDVTGVYDIFVEVVFALPTASAGNVELQIVPSGWSINGGVTFNRQMANSNGTFSPTTQQCVFHPQGPITATGTFTLNWGYDGGNNANVSFCNIVINRTQ